MIWRINLLEYDIKCPDCGHEHFTHIPVQDAYRCDSCNNLWASEYLLDRATVKNPLKEYLELLAEKRLIRGPFE